MRYCHNAGRGGGGGGGVGGGCHAKTFDISNISITEQFYLKLRIVVHYYN